jgi:hypothetical protein
MTRDLLGFSDWTSAEIDLRQQWMALVASKIWSESGANGERQDLPTLDEIRQSPETHGIETAPLPADAVESA